MTTNEQIHDDINQALTDLGRTVPAIAQQLTALGVTGVPGNPFSCPLTNFIARNFAVEEPDVNGTEAQWSLDGELYSVLLSKPLVDFIQEFDAGEFPALIHHEAKP